jgi:hypothetical protein
LARRIKHHRNHALSASVFWTEGGPSHTKPACHRGADTGRVQSFAFYVCTFDGFFRESQKFSLKAQLEAQLHHFAQEPTLFQVGLAERVEQ